MKKTFEAEIQAASVKVADEWWTAQSGLRKVQRTIIATGSNGPARGDMDRWGDDDSLRGFLMVSAL